MTSLASPKLVFEHIVPLSPRALSGLDTLYGIAHLTFLMEILYAPFHSQVVKI